jgi:hypothetical protein
LTHLEIVMALERDIDDPKSMAPSEGKTLNSVVGGGLGAQMLSGMRRAAMTWDERIEEARAAYYG